MDRYLSEDKPVLLSGPYFVYLDALRESGKCNMFEAPKYLRANFGLSEDVDGKRESFRIVKLYMDGKDPDCLYDVDRPEVQE